jgi:hypothetical protein
MSNLKDSRYSVILIFFSANVRVFINTLLEPTYRRIEQNQDVWAEFTRSLLISSIVNNFLFRIELKSIMFGNMGSDS